MSAVGEFRRTIRLEVADRAEGIPGQGRRFRPVSPPIGVSDDAAVSAAGGFRRTIRREFADRAERILGAHVRSDHAVQSWNDQTSRIKRFPARGQSQRLDLRHRQAAPAGRPAPSPATLESPPSKPPSSGTPRPDPLTTLDINQLTERVYGQLERKLRIEKERRGL